MANFDRKLSDKARAAIFDAAIARQIQHARILELLLAGELVPGEKPQITLGYIRQIVAKEKKRRQGKAASKTAQLPPKEAVETLRQRMVNLADSEALHLERAKEGELDLDRAERLAKLIVAIARIPAPKDVAPKNPATRDAQGERGPELKGSTGGALLAAHRQTAGTLQSEYRHDTEANTVSQPAHEGVADSEAREVGARTGSQRGARTEQQLAA